MRTTKGFTLIELLVVVAIIALLVSILMPSLQKAKDMAKDMVCRSNEKNIAYGIFMYAEDNDDAFPYTLDKKRGFDDQPYSWCVVVGKVSKDQGTKMRGEWVHWPGDYWPVDGDPEDDPTHMRIVCGGYVDYPSHGCNMCVPYEGAFVCPAFIDQVEPKAKWPGGTSCQFSMNNNLGRLFEEFNTKVPVTVTLTSEVKRNAVLIGDACLNTGGEIRAEKHYRTNIPGDGSLYYKAGPAGEKYRNDFGPWTHTSTVSPWNPGTNIVDFYGHPGGRANIAYTDGHVSPMDPIEHSAWKIK